MDDTLAQLNITDPLTGKVITADDVFMDWAAALYLMDESVGDGRYTYHNYPEAPQYTPTEVISDCPRSFGGWVNQYGIDYHTIICPGEHTLNFTGSTVSKLLSVNANSGTHAFWSNKGNASNMTLTREFDFTDVTGPITISYSTWYDIEKDWDYLHLAASTDGESWELLTTPSGTDYNPIGTSYGADPEAGRPAAGHAQRRDSVVAGQGSFRDTSIMTLLEQGSEGIRQLMQEAEQFALSRSRMPRPRRGRRMPLTA